MVLKLRRTGDIDIIDVLGDMDFYNSYKLKDFAHELFQGGSCIIFINLDEVHEIDSSGIGTLIDVVSTARKLSIQMVLINIHASVLKVIELTRLVSFFPIAETLEDALKLATP